jgi:hypothetical protein
MKHHYHSPLLPYTGEALANHWIYKNHGMVGDAVVGFSGPCRVDLDAMVDLEDVLNDDDIYSPMMLHFIVEVFGTSLKEGVLLQRLFTSILCDKVNAAVEQLGGVDGGNKRLPRVRRQGDDLFVDDTKKLSVSICTLSPTSTLIHTGLNIESEGTPVEAAGLTSELGITDIEGFAQGAMRALCKEWEDTIRCTCKVRAVS